MDIETHRRQNERFFSRPSITKLRLTDHEASLLEHVRLYVRAGVGVFPIDPRWGYERSPMWREQPDNTLPFFPSRFATTNKKVVDGLWTGKFRGYDIGCPVGAHAGLAAPGLAAVRIMFDDYLGEVRGMAGPLPANTIQVGNDFLFRAPKLMFDRDFVLPTGWQKRSGPGIRLAPGVRLLGPVEANDRYPAHVVLPPSGITRRAPGDDCIFGFQSLGDPPLNPAVVGFDEMRFVRPAGGIDDFVHTLAHLGELPRGWIDYARHHACG